MARCVDFEDLKTCVDQCIKIGWTLEDFRVSLEEWDDFIDAYSWRTEGIPEEHDSIFAKFKGTEKWSRHMHAKCSDQHEVTIEFPDGRRITKRTTTQDGEWWIDPWMTDRGARVIAWRPLSEAYDPKKATT